MEKNDPYTHNSNAFARLLHDEIVSRAQKYGYGSVSPILDDIFNLVAPGWDYPEDPAHIKEIISDLHGLVEGLIKALSDFEDNSPPPGVPAGATKNASQRVLSSGSVAEGDNYRHEDKETGQVSKTVVVQDLVTKKPVALTTTVLVSKPTTGTKKDLLNGNLYVPGLLEPGHEMNGLDQIAQESSPDVDNSGSPSSTPNDDDGGFGPGSISSGGSDLTVTSDGTNVL